MRACLDAYLCACNVRMAHMLDVPSNQPASQSVSQSAISHAANIFHCQCLRQRKKPAKAMQNRNGISMQPNSWQTSRSSSRTVLSLVVSRATSSAPIWRTDIRTCCCACVLCVNGGLRQLRQSTQICTLEIDDSDDVSDDNDDNAMSHFLCVCALDLAHYICATLTIGSR